MFLARQANMRQIVGFSRRAAASGLIASILGSTAAAQPGAALTLSRGPDHAETVEFTLEQLAELPQKTILTENEFVDGRTAYRGPLVRDVIERLRLGEAETLLFIAANDYHVEIPTSDFREYDVILALEADGTRLSSRDKGPLWLMYPISDHAALRDPRYVERLIWQVVRIESP